MNLSPCERCLIYDFPRPDFTLVTVQMGMGRKIATLLGEGIDSGDVAMEDMSNIAFKAHLAGIPALATPADGTNDILLDAITKILLESTDDPCKDRVHGKLGQLLSDHKMHGKMGRAAKKMRNRAILD